MQNSHCLLGLVFKPFHAVKEIFTNIIIPSLPAELVLSCFGWLGRSSPSSTCWSCNLRWAGWLRRWLALWWGHRYLPTRTHSHTQLDGQTTFPWSKNQWSSYSTRRSCSTTCTKRHISIKRIFHFTSSRFECSNLDGWFQLCKIIQWTAKYSARSNLCKLGMTSYDRTIGINIQPKKQIRWTGITLT